MGGHDELHSEEGALRGEHPGRDANPVIKIRDLAWLEFEKPDLEKAHTFAGAFGFGTALATNDEIHLRGDRAGSPCVLIRRGPRSRFVGPAFAAADDADVARLAAATGASVRPLPESLGGVSVDLVDPNGLPVRVVSGTEVLAAQIPQAPHIFNFGSERQRPINSMQRPPKVPTSVQRLGHVVVQTTKYVESLNWYLHHLGMIVSDFCFYTGQRERGPVMSFIRCDRGQTATDHHTLARYVHSAYQVSDLDALAAGGQYLGERGYQRSWGIGRHIQGSQIFDYWRDPDGFLVEHFTDGDMFDCTVETGWAPFTASGLYQWGPPVSQDFLGVGTPEESAREMEAMVDALQDNDNEFDLSALRGMMSIPNS
jgi:catechol 2,3-dioxygenase-like lactoylglutathione lyase family enzyme